MNLMMISLNLIDKSQLRACIRLAFDQDEELLQNIHIAAPGRLEDLVDHTFKNLSEQCDDYDPDYYRVMLLNVPIGFCVLLHKPKRMLISYGINIRFRKANILLEWLQQVRNAYDGEKFIVCMYEKNVRAIRFFQRNGFSNLKKENNSVFLWA